MDYSKTKIRILFVRSGNNGPDPITTNQGKSLLKEGVDLQFFDIIGKGIFGYLSNLKKLKRQIKFFQPNLIHCHYSLSCFLASLTLTRKPIIASLMGSDIYSSGKIKLIITKILSRYWWKSTIVKSDNLFHKLGIKTANVIPNGVDYDDFKIVQKHEAQSILGWEPKHRHIIIASDPSRMEKNFPLAESAIRILNDQNIQFETHFLKGIEFSKMVFFYCAADVLLLTSFYEGSANVIKEAMACNCPIVSTDAGDVKWVFGETAGCFIASLNPVELAEKIRLAIEFSVENRRTNGRKRITELGLDSKTVSEKLFTIYEKVLK